MDGFKSRACAYCRVSTDKEDQANSFESQLRFFKEYISREPSWEYCGIYSDEGISGTSTKGRMGFNNMISAAEAGEIDLIITKEISRFARNTLDSIYYTRALRAIGVGVIFLADGINTLEPDSELRLTIMASVAQEESRRTSERVKWGQRRQMERGVVFGRTPFGYILQGGKLEIKPEEAEAIRRIFLCYTGEGLGSCKIAEMLNETGVVSPGAGKRWTSGAVVRILRNEKYCGDLVQQKTYTPDYLTHEKRINRGQLKLIELRDHHPAIITRESFQKAAERLRGSSFKRGKGPFPLSGKVRCGFCGAVYTSKYKKNKSSGYRIWRPSCGCGNKYVRDDRLMEAVALSLGKLNAAELAKKVCGALSVCGVEIKASRICGLLEGEAYYPIACGAVEQIRVKNGAAEVILWDDTGSGGWRKG